MRKRIPLLVLLLVAIVGVVIVASSPAPQPVAAPVTSELIDANNNPLNFEKFRGKVVFVNNWASWCPPCVAEMPTIDKLRKTIDDPNLVFVMVSYDEKAERAMSFMKKKGYDFDVYFPGSKYPFNTESIPATYIIDKNGKVLGPHVGMADYSQADFVNQVKSLLSAK